MILTCNSCGKKFVVPDSAISASGRLVQCGSCGNKWKQFPVGKIIKKTQSIKKPPKISFKMLKFNGKTETKKSKKTAPKNQEISLYSPEYLAKKHGIKIDETQTCKEKLVKKKKISFFWVFITH